MLKLFLSPGSSSMAPHIALHEIGVPFETQSVSLARKENRAAAFLALNPEGKVPTLLIDGRPLSEVAAILFYLARRFPESELLPTDAEGEAQAISWMSFIAATVHPARSKERSTPTRCSGSPIGGSEGGSGRCRAIRSRISICSGCIGVSPTPSSPRRGRFPISKAITSA